MTQAYDPAVLKAQLIRDEGDKRMLYKDDRGFLTGLIGHNFSITQSVYVRDALYGCDVAGCEASLDLHWPWWRQLDPARQTVLMNMMFNMGAGGLGTFVSTLAHIKSGEYDLAADGMLASKWRTQVGDRAVRLSLIMRTGLIT